MLQTSLGASRLLAHPGDRRLCLLDPPATVLWDLHASGLNAAVLAELLVARFGLAAATARAQVEGLIAGWRQAGLLDAGAVTPDWRLGDPADPALPPPRPSPAPTEAWRVHVADRAVSLGCDDPAFARTLSRWFTPPWGQPAAAGPVDHRLHLYGAPQLGG